MIDKLTLFLCSSSAEVHKYCSVTDSNDVYFVKPEYVDTSEQISTWTLSDHTIVTDLVTGL